MIDRIVYKDEKHSSSSFLVQAGNVLVKDGYLTEGGMVENMAQTAAAHAGVLANKLDQPVGLGYIGAIKNLEVFALPEINNTLDTEITLDNQIFDVTLLSAKVKCNDEVYAQCQMKVFTIKQP
jgi:predicted hotdog family 3-hydroxylacyl-ACP dehydratase